MESCRIRSRRDEFRTAHRTSQPVSLDRSCRLSGRRFRRARVSRPRRPARPASRSKSTRPERSTAPRPGQPVRAGALGSAGPGLRLGELAGRRDDRRRQGGRARHAHGRDLRLQREDGPRAAGVATVGAHPQLDSHSCRLEPCRRLPRRAGQTAVDHRRCGFPLEAEPAGWPRGVLREREGPFRLPDPAHLQSLGIRRKRLLRPRLRHAGRRRHHRKRPAGHRLRILRPLHLRAQARRAARAGLPDQSS